MRGRAMISNRVLAHGNGVVEMRERDGKTFVVINDFQKLRHLFGQLLAEVQRITSEGDFDAGKKLMETYGVQVNRALHEQVLARNATLNLATFRGFVNPVYTLVRDANGTIIDVTVSYDEDFVTQQLRYSREFSVLPLRN
jgi:dipeptidyl-peptidase-3